LRVNQDETSDPPLKDAPVIIHLHFEPIAYGITSVATYIMKFTIQTFGQSTFTLSGGPVPVTNAGATVLNGPAKASWQFPPIVITL
jgi:hypothetical protein